MGIGSRRTRAVRRETERTKRARAYRIATLGGYDPFRGWVDHEPFYECRVMLPVGDHVKYPKNSHSRRYAKRVSNRRLRHAKGELLLQHGRYRRVFDLWFEIL